MVTNVENTGCHKPTATGDGLDIANINMMITWRWFMKMDSPH